MATNKGSTTYRNYPDVAMVADNIFMVADNGEEEISGGTSAATPLWAGFTALVNQQAVATGGAGNTVGFLNPALYHIGTNSGYTASFNDITVGNNTNFNATQYLATPGYDLCTGWGSPAGGSLITALTQPDGFQIIPGRGPVANGPVGGPFTVSAQTLILTNGGKAPFSWSLGTTSAWLNVSENSGTLAVGGTGAGHRDAQRGGKFTAGGSLFSQYMVYEHDQRPGATPAIHRASGPGTGAGRRL